MLNGNVFVYGISNIEIQYNAGVDNTSPDNLDDRLAITELTCIAYLVKFFIANRGDDSIKFASAPSLGTNQYSSRPGIMQKMLEIIKETVPSKIRFG